MSQILSFSNKHRREVIRHQFLGASFGGGAACCVRRVLLPFSFAHSEVAVVFKSIGFFFGEDEVNVFPLTPSAGSWTGNLDTCALFPPCAVVCTVGRNVL